MEHMINVEVKVDELSKMICGKSEKVIAHYIPQLNYVIPGYISVLDDECNEIQKYDVDKQMFFLDRSISAYQYRFCFYIGSSDEFMRVYLPCTRDDANMVIDQFLNGETSYIVDEKTGNKIKCRFVR